MYENSDLPPEVFMKEVLYYYNIEKKSVEEIAKFYDVSETIIRRVIKQYETLKEKPIEFKQINKNELCELKDHERKSKEKITDEDITDLQIDLKLFEKGIEPKDIEGEEK